MLQNTHSISQGDLHHEKLCDLISVRDAGVGGGINDRKEEL